MNRLLLFVSSLLLLVVCGICQDRSPYGHSPPTVVDAVTDYWLSQPLGNTDGYQIFSQFITDDVTLSNTVLKDPIAVGKQNVMNLLLAVPAGVSGYFVKSIDAIIVKDSDDRTWVTAQVNKTLCGTGTKKCAYNLNHGFFAYTKSAGSQRKIYKMLETTPAQYFKDVLPFGMYDGGNAHSVASMCDLITATCAGIDIDYGVDDRGEAKSCYQHWLGAPLYPNKFYVFDVEGYGTGCVTLNMGSLYSGKTPQDVCYKFGVAQPNLKGCWNPTSF